MASTRMTCCSVGISARTGAIFLRYSAFDVTIAAPPPITTRCLIGSGPNALNSGAKTLRALSVPSTATYNCGTRPMRLKTRSPGAMPMLRNAFAKALVRRCRSAYVTSVSPPCLPKQRSATRSPRPATTCRSTASYAMLNPPPGNPSSHCSADSQVKSARAAA